MPTLLLASGSPRRRQFLTDLGFAFGVSPAGIDESVLPGEHAKVYAARLARTKAEAPREAPHDAVVLAADTVVTLGGEIFGKPESAADFRRMMGRLSGATHEVITAVAVRTSSATLEAQVSTRVTMRALTAAELDWYWASGEPTDKAGGYALQGIAGAFVTRVDGSHSNVIGLPLVETIALLEQAGVRPPWRG